MQRDGAKGGWKGARPAAGWKARVIAWVWVVCVGRWVGMSVDCVISTPVILNGGYNYRMSCLYAMHIKISRMAKAREGRGTSKRARAPRSAAFINNQ